MTTEKQIEEGLIGKLSDYKCIYRPGIRNLDFLRMKRIGIVFLLLIITTVFSYSQTCEFKFQSEGDSWIDTMFNYTMTRTYINDSVFIDSPVFCASDTAKECAIQYKKIRTDWFIWADGVWQEFYSSQDSLIKVVYFKDEQYIFKPVGYSLVYNDIKLRGFIKEPLYVITCDNSTLWFHPDYGIVGIGDARLLIREDFKNHKR